MPEQGTGKVDVSVGAATEQDLKELMMGNAGQTVGAPTPEQAWGYTNQPQGVSDINRPRSLAELELEAKQAEARAIAMGTYQPQQPQYTQQSPEEIEHYKRLYGQSENEKGELRRTVQEQIELNKQLSEQMQALLMQAQSAQFQRPPTYPTYPQTPAPYPPQSFRDPFEGKTDDDFFSVRDAKRFVNESLTPILAASQQQMLMAMDQREASAKRAANNLSLMDEQRVMFRNPWLQSIQSESQRVDAILAQLRAEKIQQQIASASNVLQQQPAPPQQPQNVQRTVRTITHIEGSSPQSPELSENAIQAGFERELAEAKLLPVETGARAKRLREISQKYGLPVGQPQEAYIISR